MEGEDRVSFEINFCRFDTPRAARKMLRESFASPVAQAAFDLATWLAIASMSAGDRQS
jgi:hypothetical protein